MNELITAGSPLTMSSMEIAELVEARHDNVRRTIERLADRSAIQLPASEEVPNHLGQRVSVYRLVKRDSYVVVAQLSPEFTARLVDRWQELEAKVAAPPTIDLRDIRQLAPLTLQLAHLVHEQQTQLEAQAPKVKFAEAVGAAENDQSIGDVAKALGTGQKRLFAFLRERRILRANNTPFQEHVERGRFRVIEVPYRDPASGEQRMRLQTRVTGRGVTYLQQLLARTSELQGA